MFVHIYLRRYIDIKVAGYLDRRNGAVFNSLNNL